MTRVERYRYVNRKTRFVVGVFSTWIAGILSLGVSYVLPNVFAGSLFAAFLLVIVVRASRMALIVDRQAITIRNLLSSTSLEWNEVTAIEAKPLRLAGREMCLHFRSRDDHTAPATVTFAPGRTGEKLYSQLRMFIGGRSIEMSFRPPESPGRRFDRAASDWRGPAKSVDG